MTKLVQLLGCESLPVLLQLSSEELNTLLAILLVSTHPLVVFRNSPIVSTCPEQLVSNGQTPLVTSNLHIKQIGDGMIAGQFDLTAGGPGICFCPTRVRDAVFVVF